MPADLPLPGLIVFGEALTDFVRTGEDAWTSVAGGACWNVARVTSTLGIGTAWAGAVSDDLFGVDIVTKSRIAGLDMRYLQVAPKPPLIAMVHQLDPPSYFFLGTDTADLAFDDSALPTGWDEACTHAHFGCISLVREPLGTRLRAIARRLSSMGVKISFDPNCRNLMGAGYPEMFEELARIAWVIKVSEEDIRHIYPALGTTQALARIREVSPSACLLHTDGAQGMTLYTPQGDAYAQPVFKVAVSDTIGAGDASIGGLLASVISRPDADWKQHVRFAAATASAACTRAGAHAPGISEVEQLLGRGE